MHINCSKCGAFNRNGAQFCAMCGNRLPAAAPAAQPPHRPALQPPQPLPPVPYQPGAPLQSPPPAPVARQVVMPRPNTFRRGPLVEGRVNVVDPERQEKAPFDPARAMVMLSFIFVILGLLLGFAAAGMALGIILLILGVGIGLLGCLASLILLPLKMLLSPVINFIRGDPMVSVLNLQVMDNATGAPVDVLLYRKPGGGNVRLGDVVQVYGARQRGSNVIRAWRICVAESGGRPTDYKIEALKPWPIWVGLLILGSAAVGALALAGVVHIW